MKIVMDTPSLINLQLVNVLNMSLPYFDIHVPRSVQKELKDMSKFSDREGAAARKVLRLISGKKIHALPVKNKKRVKELTKGRKWDRGEIECLVLAEENKISDLITDDYDILPRLLKSAGKVHINLSPFVIIYLSYKGRISKERAKEKIREIVSLRGWSARLTEHVLERYK